MAGLLGDAPVSGQGDSRCRWAEQGMADRGSAVRWCGSGAVRVRVRLRCGCGSGTGAGCAGRRCGVRRAGGHCGCDAGERCGTSTVPWSGVVSPARRWRVGSVNGSGVPSWWRTCCVRSVAAVGACGRW